METFLQLAVKLFPFTTIVLIACCSQKKDPPLPRSPAVSKDKINTTENVNEILKSTSPVKSENLEDARAPNIVVEANEGKCKKSEKRELQLLDKKPDAEKLQTTSTTSETEDEKKTEDKEDKKEKDKVDPDKEVVLDDGNDHIAFVTEFMNMKQGTEQVQELCFHGRAIVDQIGCYHWAMKKRFGFDETSWKQISRRISMLKSEGFNVRVNTRKARENKNICEPTDTKIDIIMNKRGAKKKKKKPKDM